VTVAGVPVLSRSLVIVAFVPFMAFPRMLAGPVRDSPLY
jgi:hypothetical protein